MRTTIFTQPGNQKNLVRKWDLLAIFLIITIVWAICWASSYMTGQFQIGDTINISLSPWYLPLYSLETVIRMFIALGISFLFSFIVGGIAAKNQRAGQIILPILDVLQSLPILGYLSILIVFFIALFPGSLLGPQFAAIFAVFTSQVWNMTFSFYQSVRTVPKELTDTADLYGLSMWQKFWKVEVPFSMPNLIWNAMASMSGGWFFVVASEAISVGNKKVMLPGVGSYIQTAINASNLSAIFYAISAMFLVIMLYDQFIFRPLVVWSQKFKMSDEQDDSTKSWFYTLLQRTRFWSFITNKFSDFGNLVINLPIFKRKPGRSRNQHLMADDEPTIINQILWTGSLFLAGLLFAYVGWQFIFKGTTISWGETVHVFILGFYTALRVLILVLLCSLLWLPLGIWAGLRPKVSQKIQAIAQVLAAFPANLFFPLIVLAILKFDLNINIWCAPLMILGTQWYILFNVIAGSSAIPPELKLAAKNLQLGFFARWFKFFIPAILPYYITGAITAAGGAWNASIVAEYMQWGDTTLIAQGLGSYVAEQTVAGDMPRLALGVTMMGVWVTGVNRFFWRRLYQWAERTCNIYG